LAGTPEPVERGGEPRDGGPGAASVEAPGGGEAPGPPEGPLPGPAPQAALDRPLPEGQSLDELARRAEAAIDAGDAAEAVERLLDLAAANRAAGHVAAAIDACYLALSADPDDIGLHLALVRLYDDRGWSVLAGEKLELLDRLVALGEDPEGAARVAAARSARR
jgi:hypothetical protein